ncbi:transmembrane protein 245 isoform X2 [Procambarus clarkii]|uniref:transmembrane protein 245 isoform X2 n=1 Tax=Procambarus clarkii TaxID=6728 RepID=UPI001E67164E|nr:transmembrane protein 245-like isoform X1 [Procambarus clarkii]
MALYGENVRSPLEQVWRQFVPQGYDQALRNAFYNVAAIVFVGCVAAAAWSVYMIFQPFVQPLLWAVLCGSLLHPAKHTVTTWTQGWLSEVQSTHGLLSFAIALLPLRLLDTISEVVGRFVVRHVRSVVMVTVILPVVYIIIHHTPEVLTSFAYATFSCLCYFITAVVSIVTTNGYIALALVLGYLGAVMFCWSGKTADVLGRLSLVVWLVAAAGVAGLWPAGSVPVFLILCLLLVAGLCTEVLDVHAALKSSTEEEGASLLEAAVLVCLRSDRLQELSALPLENTPDNHEKSTSLSPVAEESVNDVGEHSSDSQLSTIPEISAASSIKQDSGGSAADTDTIQDNEEKPTDGDSSGALQDQVEKEELASSSDKAQDEEKLQAPAKDLYLTPMVDTPRPRVLLSSGVPSRATSSHTLTSLDGSTSRISSDDENGSNIYLKGVFVACILVELWQHNYLLPLLPLAIIYYFVKKIASRYLAWSLENGNAVSTIISTARSNVAAFAEARRAAFFPPPVKGVAKLLVRSDHHLVVALSTAVDAIVSLLLILAVIFFAVTASVFLAVQIQGESMALVTLGSQVINSTVVNNPQFLALLPEGLGEVMSSALDEGYLYGREWIASMVRGMLGETDEDKAIQLEKQGQSDVRTSDLTGSFKRAMCPQLMQSEYLASSCVTLRDVHTPHQPTPILVSLVVELWDRIYQAWVAAHPLPPARGPVVTSEAVAMTFDSLVEGLRKTPGVVSFTFVSEVIRDNLGTVVSVLESVWSILLGNLSLAMSALTAAASLLLGGSLSLLNALISVVIFMSSLFYVLSASDCVYKPVAILANLAPGQMNHLGKAVEDAVNGVFIASLKMGAFYGMWTWLLHSLFSTNIVYIPSVLGAVFGAVPLVGTYWAAIPGVLELCWSRGSPTLGALLFGAQLLPMSCVDTAIYSDIKGGSHPYLTGLAVAGGIFYWGVEGAILGPLLLCILKVATNMYSTLIQSPGDITRRFSRLRRSQSELAI